MRLPLSIAALIAAAATSLAAPAVAGATPLRARSGAYEVQLLVDGVPATSFDHAGESYVLGRLGDRYTIRVVNHTGRRVEAVVSVDGRDVVDGRPGDWRVRRGYVVPAWGSVDIAGWRMSLGDVAAFRFSRVADSYAARMGRGRDVGVVGVALFPEREAPRPIIVAPPPPPPPWWSGSADREERAPSAAPDGASSGSATAPASPSPSPSPSRSAEAVRPSERPGLGTEWGETLASHVQEVPFARQSPSRPDAILGVRYNDWRGLLAMGVDVWSCGCDCSPEACVDEATVRRTADPFPTTDRGFAAPPPGWR